MAEKQKKVKDAGLFQKIFYDLNRIQYPPSPEVFQSELAWRITNAGTQKNKNGKTLGYVYEANDPEEELKNITRIRTRSSAPDFTNNLKGHGVSTVSDQDQDLLAETLLDSFKGSKPDKGMGMASSPVFAETALAMNGDGILGGNAPNFGLIIEQLYRLGSAERVEKNRASSIWYNCQTPVVKNGFYDRLRHAVRDSSIVPDHVVMPEPNENKGDLIDGMPPWLKPYGTPFRWFKGNWDTLCSPEWVTALPRRRWADWAGCLLRTAVGMGYLWESRFFHRIGINLMAEDFDAEKSIHHALKDDPMLQWIHESEPVTARDTNGKIKQTVFCGQKVYKFIEEIIDKNKDSIEKEIRGLSSAETLPKFLQYVHGLLNEEQVKGKLKECFSASTPSYANNRYEAIRYSLTCRKRFGEDADYYSLIQIASRNYRVVSPGPEFMVVLASLSAGALAGKTTLGKIRGDLKMLGLQPHRSLIVKELERCGLCHSSHDADNAITVTSGFGS